MRPAWATLAGGRAPLGAADVGALRRRFAATQSVLYKPDDTNSIKQAVARQLVEPSPYDSRTQTWEGGGGQARGLVVCVNPR